MDCGGGTFETEIKLKKDEVEDSLLLIKQWIFEHACKYRMSDVLRAIFEKKGSKSLSHFRDTTFIKPNPAFMFVTLVEVFQQTLRTEISWDATLLVLITEILEDLYKKNKFVSVKRFKNISTRLKLMELLQLMVDGRDSSEVVRRLNVHFPRWSKNTEDNLKAQYKISNMTVLKKLEKTFVASRRFILELLVSKDKWRNYEEKSYNSDVKQFAETVSKELVEIMKVLRPELPPSPIEQVLFGANEDLTNSDDAAIQTLLEHLHDGMDEADFLTLLSILEPDLESQVNPKPFAPIFDGFFESPSLNDVKTISSSDSDASTLRFNDEHETTDADSPELFNFRRDVLHQESDNDSSAICIDDLPPEDSSTPNLTPKDETEIPLPDLEAAAENEKVPKKRKRRSRRQPESVVSCSEVYKHPK